MQRDYPVVFWQNMPTHHQSALISAFAESSSAPIRVAIESSLPNWRRETGWEATAYEPAAVDIGLTPDKVDQIVKESGGNAIHIFGGIDAYPAIYHAFRKCAQEGVRMGLMAESANPGGLPGLARKLAWRIKQIRYGRYLDFILAIGEGPQSEFFGARGFPRERIFEFGYFPPAPVKGAADERFWTDGAVRILYIGRLIPLKGVLRLLEVLSQIGGEWQLRLIGTGEDEAELRAMTQRKRIQARVRFDGAMSNTAAMEVLAGADLLVLPSSGDGWGAVISEALCRGVPVVCSDRCGARQAVERDESMGNVFPWESDGHLRKALEAWISRGRRSGEERDRLKNLASGLLPRSGADYLAKIIQHTYGAGPRPKAPWRGI